MAKLTADLVLGAPQFMNPLGDREIDLRELKLTAIENLGATLDQFDVMDFSDNDIRKLDGFPKLKRLKTLLLNNNRISRIAPDLVDSIPNLEELILTANQLNELGDLQPLAAFTKLNMISLVKNPVAHIQHYRAFLIHTIPSLTIIDFQKVKDEERRQAKKLFSGKAGKKLLEELAQTNGAQSASSKRIVEAAQAAAPAQARPEMERIKALIEQATSLEEVQRLEQQLRGGQVPGANDMMITE